MKRINRHLSVAVLILFTTVFSVNIIFGEETAQPQTSSAEAETGQKKQTTNKKADQKPIVRIGFSALKLGTHLEYITRHLATWDGVHKQKTKKFKVNTPARWDIFFHYGEHYYSDRYCRFYFTIDTKELFRLVVYNYMGQVEVDILNKQFTKRYSTEPKDDNGALVWEFKAQYLNEERDYKIIIRLDADTNFGKMYTVEYIDLTSVKRTEERLPEKYAETLKLF